MHQSIWAGAAMAAVLGAGAQAHAQVRDFAIPREPAAQALPEFGRQAGRPILAAGRILDGVSTAPVQGRMEVSVALARLLEGTGLRADIGPDGAIVVVRAAEPAAAPAAAPVDPAAPAAIEEVVVTANKREERLRDVPAAVSAMTGKVLTDMGAQKLEDYSGYLPAMTFNSSGVPGIGYVGLRGVAPSDDAGGTMAFYVGDVPVNRSSPTGPAATSNLDLSPYDVERVEVLRGPQGTLYGANSLGGILRYVLRKPSLTEVEGAVGGETWGLAHSDRLGWIGRASLSVPIVPGELAVRASFGRREDPGFLDNVAPGGRSDFNRGVSDVYRVALTWVPTDRFSADLDLVRQTNAYDGQARVALDPATRRPAFGPYANSYVLPVSADQSYSIAGATLRYDFGPMVLTSATGYSVTHWDQVSDLTRSFSFLPGRTLYSAPSRGEKVVQEIRLASPDTASLKWVVGAYYTRETFRQPITATLVEPAVTSPVAGLNPLALLPLTSSYKEFSGFADVTVPVTDRLEAGAGLRVSRNETTSTAGFGGVLFGAGPGVTSFSGEGRKTVTLWSATLKYQLAEGAQAYVRLATGYRPGAANNAFPGVPKTFDPDKTTSVELGAKATLADGRLYVEGALFNIDWDRIQLAQSYLGVLSYTVNGGSARSRGFELSGVWRPDPRFQLTGALSYSDARLRHPSAAFPLGRENQPLPLVTPWTASLAADWTFFERGPWAAKGRLGARYYDKTSYRFFDPLGPAIPSATLVDASATLIHGRYTLGLFARNLTDERRVFIAVPVEEVIGEPRTIGLRADVAF